MLLQKINKLVNPPYFGYWHARSGMLGTDIYNLLSKHSPKEDANLDTMLERFQVNICLADPDEAASVLLISSFLMEDTFVPVIW